MPAKAHQGHWLELIRCAGEDGLRWIRTYRAYTDLEAVAAEVLTALRRRQLEVGLAMLQELRVVWQEARTEAPTSIRCVMDRWYFGTASYYYYVVQDFEQAEQILKQTSEAVVAAISADRVLLPLAHQCHEFCLHHARIARNQDDWERLDELLQRVRAMVRDQEPLCCLHGGVQVFYSDIVDFLMLHCAEESLLEQSELAALFRVDLRTQVLEGYLRQHFKTLGKEGP